MNVNAILVGALVVSLGGNVFFLVTRGGPDDAPARAPTSKKKKKGADATPVAPGECVTKLEACEAAVKLQPFLVGKGRPYAGSDRDTPEDAHKDLLCSLARSNAEEYWRLKEIEITLGLRHSLADEETQERDVQAAVEKYAEQLGFSDKDRETFERRYRDERLSRMKNVQAAMEKDPPDFKAVVEQTRALFKVEDQLARDIGGDQAVRVLRDSEREPRAALLSVAASLAGIPWEDAMPD